MDLLIIFAATLILITIAGAKFRFPPFFTLVGGAILFGLLAGLGPDRVLQSIVSGMGKVFAAFGIIILSGAIIAKLLQEQHQIEELVSDIRRHVRRPSVISGFSGYLLSVPATCCITAYIMLLPILEHLGGKKNTTLLYLAAIGSILSYALIYPTPVVIPLITAFGKDISPLTFDAITIPLSLAILAGLILAARWWYPRTVADQPGPVLPESSLSSEPPAGGSSGVSFHWRAWAPFLVIVGAIPFGTFVLGMSHVALINFIMLSGAAAALLLASAGPWRSGISQGTKHAGMIIFDICGAGALGYVIVDSGFATQALEQITGFFPVLLVPFVLAALIATAQGSRVVTSVITAQVLAGTTVAAAIHPIPLILMIAAGSCVISYVTDPYFWLVQRTTGDPLPAVFRNYTVPLACTGVVILMAGVLFNLFLFR